LQRETCHVELLKFQLQIFEEKEPDGEIVEEHLE